MSVHDAKPDDVYVDESGKLWRVVGMFTEPAVTVEEIEVSNPDTYATKARMTGGLSGLMWNGFQRIYRKQELPEGAFTPNR